jgi:hypothetical protein
LENDYIFSISDVKLFLCVFEMHGDNGDTVSSLGFFWEVWGLWFCLADFFKLSLLFQNLLVVICLELKGIGNGSKWL